VRGAVRDAVDDAVRGAVDDAVRGAVGGAQFSDRLSRGALAAIRDGWHSVLGGQLWVGGWYWGGAWTSFFRDVCDLELPGDLWDRARAYEATMESACWWYPHRRFVMVSERPVSISRELTNPDVPRGWGSHRLHNSQGPAIIWPDGWGLWTIHGVRVTQQIVEAPETLTPKQITGEPNAEVRRIMLERFGAERYVRELGAKRVQADDYGALYRVELGDDEPLVMVELENSTPEPDGSHKVYWLRVPPTITTAREAVAWTFGYEKSDEYQPEFET
jgi:hypothetical protein